MRAIVKLGAAGAIAGGLAFGAAPAQADAGIPLEKSTAVAEEAVAGPVEAGSSVISAGSSAVSCGLSSISGGIWCLPG